MLTRGNHFYALQKKNDGFSTPITFLVLATIKWNDQSTQMYALKYWFRTLMYNSQCIAMDAFLTVVGALVRLIIPDEEDVPRRICTDPQSTLLPPLRTGSTPIV